MEDTLQALVAAGRAAWPEIAIKASAFVQYLADRLDVQGDLDASLEAVHADLYLACGCAHGDGRAIVAFERALLSRIPAFLARLDPSRDLADEVAQELRESTARSRARYRGDRGVFGARRIGKLAARRLNPHRTEVTSAQPTCGSSYGQG